MWYCVTVPTLEFDYLYIYLCYLYIYLFSVLSPSRFI